MIFPKQQVTFSVAFHSVACCRVTWYHWKIVTAAVVKYS